MRPEGEWEEPSPSALEIASYIYLGVREYSALARGAGLAETAEALEGAGREAARAMQRLGKP